MNTFLTLFKNQKYIQIVFQLLNKKWILNQFLIETNSMLRNTVNRYIPVL